MQTDSIDLVLCLGNWTLKIVCLTNCDIAPIQDVWTATAAAIRSIPFLLSLPFYWNPSLKLQVQRRWPMVGYLKLQVRQRRKCPITDYPKLQVSAATAKISSTFIVFPPKFVWKNCSDQPKSLIAHQGSSGWSVPDGPHFLSCWVNNI